MAANVAQRRSKKAARRKAVLAEKRKAAALDNSVAARIRRAVAGPIHHCKQHADLFDAGMGVLTMVRGTPGETVLCAFWLDVFYLGIKDVQIRSLTMSEADFFLGALEEAAPLKEVEPAYARKLLRDLAAWVEPIGFLPPRDFAVAERIFGDANPEACDSVFRFGKDGKPCYVPDLSESSAEKLRRVEQLRQRLGDGGFDILIEDENPEPSQSSRSA